MRLHLIAPVLLIASLLAGCQSPVPTGSRVRELHWSGSGALTSQTAETNSRIRLELYETYAAGSGRAAARMPATTMDRAPLPRYLLVEDGSASLITDYRRNRHAGKPPVDTQPARDMRLGYFERGRFIETDTMPPPGRELILLLQLEEGTEARF